MADPEQLSIIRQGTETWNKWRQQNPDIKINLSGANLSNTNLSNTNLSNANLSGAYLSEAHLPGAKLSRADLSKAFPYKTDLSEADLLATQALDTNFDNANLTGACIENWNISNETNLNNVSCDYIFLKGEWNNKTEKYDFSERRPSHPNKNFQPGEFTTLSQKALETIDLIFLDGIDWTTFLTTFQKLQIEDNSSELSIQAIENKQDGTFVIRVNTPTNTNKETIKTSFWSKYQPLLEAKNEKNYKIPNEKFSTQKKNTQKKTIQKKAQPIL